MNMLLHLHKLTDDDVQIIGLWLWKLGRQNIRVNMTLRDIALLDFETVRKGAEAWCNHFKLESIICKENLTSPTAKKLFGKQ